MEESSTLTISRYNKEYKVLRQIANGAFGSVHCVQRRDTKVIHAAKYIKSKSADLEREVNALRELSKSSLVLKFISLYHDPAGVRAVLVTEFLGGGDLCERTSSKDYVLTEQKCRTIIRQLCRGVQYIHSCNYVHLDLKPFNIVFSQKKDDYDLRIIDFGLARELNELRSVRVGMCGTIEYMSPEVMNCTEATPASDCWGIGVIAYQLLSGGVSPFFAVNRFRTMARVLDCDFSLDQPELAKTSNEAKDFISKLLQKDPHKRLTADQCLDHSWLVDDKLYLGILETLETSWMRRCLARRRWYRLLNAVRVMTSIRQISGHWDSGGSNADSSDEDETFKVSAEAASSSSNGFTTQNGFPFYDMASYTSTFEKLHLMVNNGTFGTLFCVQHQVSNEVYAAKHVRSDAEAMRKEAAILHHLRNEQSIVSFYGLYEGPNQSVIVMDFLVGGDLVERTASPEFVLNEAKCKSYIKQICQGLSHIHACKIVHLDLKPFSIVFATREEESILKITDFSLSQWLPPDRKIRITDMCGSLEFISPEVLECTYATTATDCWGIGVISYMLITGGKSPFYGGNRFRTMAKILTAQYQLDIPDLSHISKEAKDFINELLVINPIDRMSAKACLDHPWLTDDGDSVGPMHTLETSWMKQLLARRRWQRWYNAVRAMQRIRKFSAAGRQLIPSEG